MSRSPRFMKRRASDDAHESGAELYSCELAMKSFKRTREDLLPVVKDAITAGDFYDLAEGAQIVFA